MIIITVTPGGKITRNKKVLKHLGIKLGEKIELTLLPGSRVELKAAPSASNKIIASPLPSIK